MFLNWNWKSLKHLFFQLKTWLEDNKSSHGRLLLTGPSGCGIMVYIFHYFNRKHLGKSSAVICVAKSLGVNVVQFENNLLYREDRDGGVYHVILIYIFLVLLFIVQTFTVRLQEHEMDAFHDFLKNTRKAVNDNQPVILLIDSLSQHCFRYFSYLMLLFILFTVMLLLFNGL